MIDKNPRGQGSRNYFKLLRVVMSSMKRTSKASFLVIDYAEKPAVN